MFLAFSHFSAETLMHADKMPIQTVIFCTKHVNSLPVKIRDRNLIQTILAPLACKL